MMVETPVKSRKKIVDLSQWKHGSLSFGMKFFNNMGIAFSSTGMLMGFLSGLNPILAVGSMVCAPCSVACSWAADQLGSQIKKNQQKEAGENLKEAKDKAGDVALDLDDVNRVRKRVNQKLRDGEINKLDADTLDDIIDEMNDEIIFRQERERDKTGQLLSKEAPIKTVDNLDLYLGHMDDLTQKKIGKHSKMTAWGTKASLAFSSAAFTLGTIIFVSSVAPAFTVPVALSVVLGLFSASSIAVSTLINKKGSHVDMLMKVKRMFKEGIADVAMEKKHQVDGKNHSHTSETEQKVEKKSNVEKGIEPKPKSFVEQVLERESGTNLGVAAAR